VLFALWQNLLHPLQHPVAAPHGCSPGILHAKDFAKGAIKFLLKLDTAWPGLRNIFIDMAACFGLFVVLATNVMIRLFLFSYL